MAEQITASTGLAYGALSAGVQIVTGYPGSPSTEAFEALLRLAPSAVRVEWAINEKSAFDVALGATLAGLRALLCLKSVGLNVALDSLMVANLAAGPGGLVILTGDDPGGWGSQNEEDSRPLAAAAEVPVLEPTSAGQAERTMRLAFELSERHQVPVVVRVTRALTAERTAPAEDSGRAMAPRRAALSREPDRYNVLPIHVVSYHQRLQARLAAIADEFECSPLNGLEGGGAIGIVAAGHAYSKLSRVLSDTDPAAWRILRLGTIHPLPKKSITDFLGGCQKALVFEELAPYVESTVRGIAQQAGLGLPIFGRASRHIPLSGELTPAHIADALIQLVPDWKPASSEHERRSMPSRQPLCDDCPYHPAFQALLSAMGRLGGRERFIVTGETGCMVRGQLPPYTLLDVKYAMGSSIGLATGLALAGVPERVVAISGDSALLHSGIGELIDAVQAGVRLLVVVLVNETTALSGGQPHPSTPYDSRGRPRRPLDLAELIRAAGVDSIWAIDPADRESAQAVFLKGLASPQLSVVLVQRACPRVDRRSAEQPYADGS